MQIQLQLQNQTLVLDLFVAAADANSIHTCCVHVFAGFMVTVSMLRKLRTVCVALKKPVLLAVIFHVQLAPAWYLVEKLIGNGLLMDVDVEIFSIVTSPEHCCA